MTPQAAALRSNPAVVYSVVAAAIAVAACALVAIAYMLGWLPGARPATPAPSQAAATPATSGPAATSPAEALVPGEILVEPADAPPRSEPMMPTYAPPRAPAAAPAVPDELSAPTRPRPAPRNVATNPDAPPTTPVPMPAARVAPAPLPVPERYAEAPPPPHAPYARRGGRCDDCGVVAGIRTFGELWEVRVRLEDGTTARVRYRRPPPVDIGERVRLEGGRLVPE
ncbi:MAG TPA: hypothetical protein VFK48_03780 [Usitatibacter sp.]|nr:hypothetical protein [Usitatibacter sp.]